VEESEELGPDEGREASHGCRRLYCEDGG